MNTTTEKSLIKTKKTYQSDETIIAHFGEDSQKYFGAMAPPIIQTSLFAYENFDAFIRASMNERQHHLYTRGVNPTVEIFEKKLAALEHGERCKCFSSGMGAISSIFFTFLKSGDHVLVVNNIYGPARNLLSYLEKFNISVTTVNENDLSVIEKAIQPNTKLMYLESPGTMNFKMLDLEKFAALAKRNNIITAIDNTWATPLFQKPLDFGIDISIHSCTKYIGGHSDVLAGAVISSDELIDQIFEYAHQFNGSVLGPFEGWLLIRGLRSLPVRMKQHQENTQYVIDFLSTCDKVESINHPSLFTGKDKELVDKHLSGFSGLLSFELKNPSFEKVRTFIDQLQLFSIGVSWGGYESLVLSPNHGINEKDLEAENISKGLIRLSIGLENYRDLIQDLAQAFNAI
ncbi:cystathionine gamma-synthase [Scopulibacillus darangshiensis]|uniref:homocysteine desulfhydrase n=1 Tax=Scopulibacillus darangshiensis TaxID=442528 RepID=A0A4R2P7N4_9BACL|nr:PLP-dependent aspartate aminotransferase family protein [Scopulibacillus darangshiensis]TCP30959.1 cystathionine gamma-synthase [Scopulibacillus darangshiensis]